MHGTLMTVDESRSEQEKIIEIVNRLDDGAKLRRIYLILVAMAGNG